MTTSQRLERDLPTILGELALAPYPDYIDGVLATTAQRRQRSRWTFPERWPLMDIATQRVPSARLPVRQLGILALVGILVAFAATAYIGSQQRRLPPAFGPAANGVVSYNEGGTIYLYDPETAEARVLTTDAEGWIDPWFSPDGQTLLVAREPTSTTTEFGVLSVDGGDIQVITKEPITMGGWLEFSPDSRRLILTMRDEATDANPKSVMTTVGIIDIATGEVTTVETDRDPFYGTFMPDGEHILVATFKPGIPSRITTMRMDGSEPQVIVEAGPGLEVSGRPSVSGDGRLLAYTIWDRIGRSGPLHIRDLVTGADDVLPRSPGKEYAGWPRFSPDARKIAFEEGGLVDGVWANHVNVLDLATRETVVADRDFAYGGAIEWSPDGTQIILQPNDAAGKGHGHYLMDADTGAVTPAPWPATSYPSWQRTAP